MGRLLESLMQFHITVFLKLAQQAHEIEENISDVYQMANAKAGNEISQRLRDVCFCRSFRE